MNAQRLVIFDTTLRDGGHCAGKTLPVADKLEIAWNLARLRVDVIEAGFPGASDEERQAVRKIADEIRGCSIAALARGVEKDVEAASRALEGAAFPRIHIYVPTPKTAPEPGSPKAREAGLNRVKQAVRLAKKFFDDIEFSPLDASRTDEAVLTELVAAAVEAGATTVNISDTVGYSVPEQFSNLIHYLKTSVVSNDRAVLSVHCHNDLGLAVANSLAAVKAGARQVECTVNGIGERAGNAALEEIVMALRARKDYFGLETRIDTGQIAACSETVSRLTGYSVQPNKAVVGENAFRKTIEIPENGFLKKGRSFELMSPADIGRKTS